MRVVIVSIEGVLSPATVSLGQAAPIREGYLLLAGLQAVGQVIFLTEETDGDTIKDWLLAADVRGYAAVHRCPTWQTYQTWKADKVREFRSVGWDVALYVDADPSVCTETINQGVATILVAHPAYSRNEWRPDLERPVTPWSTMIDEIEAQQKAKANAERAQEGIT